MRRFAFSLVELIVVIAVVTSLMAVTVPVVQHARSLGRALVCQTHQRELLLGLLAYDTEYSTLCYGLNSDPVVIPPGGVAGSNLDPFAWWWFHYIGYRTPDGFQSQAPLTCPEKDLASPGLKMNVLWGNYGVNWSLCRSPLSSSRLKSARAERPCAVQNIKSPGQTALLLDSGYAVINWYHATPRPPQKVFVDNWPWASYVPGLSINQQPEKYLLDVQKDDAMEGRHPNKTINTGYVDGHVDRINAEQSLVTQEGDAYFGVKPFWDPFAK